MKCFCWNSETGLKQPFSVQFLTTLEAKLEEVIERKKCSLMLGLKLLFWEISMYSGKFWRKVHYKNQVQQSSDWIQCIQWCSGPILSMIKAESRKVHNMKMVAGGIIYNFYFGLFPCSVMKYGDLWLPISRFWAVWMNNPEIVSNRPVHGCFWMG